MDAMSWMTRRVSCSSRRLAFTHGSSCFEENRTAQKRGMIEDV